MAAVAALTAVRAMASGGVRDLTLAIVLRVSHKSTECVKRLRLARVLRQLFVLPTSGIVVKRDCTPLRYVFSLMFLFRILTLSRNSASVAKTRLRRIMSKSLRPSFASRLHCTMSTLSRPSILFKTSRKSGARSWSFVQAATCMRRLKRVA